MDEYTRVERELGPAPIAGQADHHVGVVDGALVIVDVWRSRADADRFAAERLFPAFERAGVTPARRRRDHRVRNRRGGGAGVTRPVAVIATVITGLAALYTLALLLGMPDPDWAYLPRGVIHLGELAALVALAVSGAAGTGLARTARARARLPR